MSRAATEVRNTGDLVNARNRLIGVMKELRGIWCDLESAGVPSLTYNRDEDLNDALLPVVDLLTLVQRHVVELEAENDQYVVDVGGPPAGSDR